MQFTGYQAVAKDWIKNPKSAHANPASYDLSIDTVIIDGEKVQPSSTVGTIVIEPQAVFVIISKEQVAVPTQGVSCYAFPKTRLCKQGLLALNTGIVDPGYDGLISTTAVNFHSRPLTLNVGDPFLRLVFFETHGETPCQSNPVPHAQYVNDRLIESADLPSSFLDVPATVNKLQDKLRADFFRLTATRAGLIIAGTALILTLCLSLLSIFAPAFVPDRYQTKTDVEQNEELRSLNDRFDKLTQQVDAIAP